VGEAEPGPKASEADHQEESGREARPSVGAIPGDRRGAHLRKILDTAGPTFVSALASCDFKLQGSVERATKFA
jgi:hypothetical protein